MAKPALQKLLSKPSHLSNAHHAQQNQFRLHDPDSPLRRKLETYIANRFYQAHNAEIAEYMPILLEMSTANKTQATLGLRPGQCSPMFLEQYLDAPIEQKIAELARSPIDRHSLMEVGNLVVTRGGAGLLLFVIMAISLAEAGYQWMAFTATPEVAKLIRRLGFKPLYLADANPNCVTGGIKGWGNYYDCHPQVMAGSLEKAMSVMRETPTLKAASIEYVDQIRALSQALINIKNGTHNTRLCLTPSELTTDKG